METLISILGNPEVITVIFSIIGIIIAYFKIGKKLADKKYGKAIMIVRDSVMEVYHEYVQELKTASEDGTLTFDEKKEAMNRAIQKIRISGLALGIDVIKALGTEYLPGIVELILGNIKNEVKYGEGI